MQLQYVHDNTGEPTAVLIPIDEWHEIIEKYGLKAEISKAQKDFIDSRLEHLAKNPNELIAMEDFLTKI